jgi:outer membrane receptor protein involved in Fe transport
VADPALGVIAEQVRAQSATFQAASVVRLADGLNVTANVSRGFRAPNAADLGNIGLTGGGGFEITPSRAAALGASVGSSGGSTARSTGVPASGRLRPEIAYQYEIGVRARTSRLSGTFSIFDAELYDFIQRRALVFRSDIVGTSISGFDVVRRDEAGLAYIAEDLRPIVTRVNTDRARILGFEAEGEARISASWTATAFFSMATGKALPGGQPLRRIAPAMGGARLRWSGDRVWVEGVTSVAADQTRLSPEDLEDARVGAVRTRGAIATFFNGTATDLGLVADGVLQATGESLADVQARVLGAAVSAPLFTAHPGFVVVGIRSGIRVTTGLDVIVFGENLTDVNYRLLGAGVDAPGFNLQIRTRYRF